MYVGTGFFFLCETHVPFHEGNQADTEDARLEYEPRAMGFGWSLAWRSGRGGHLALTLPIWAAAEPRASIPVKDVTFLPVQAAKEQWDAAGSRRDLCGALTRAGVAEGRRGLGDKRTSPGGLTTCRLSESRDPGANL